MSVLVSALVGILLAYSAPVFGVTVERDVVYATAPGYWSSAPVDQKGTVARLMMHPAILRPLELKMDIYMPEGDLSEGRPLLVMLHGGAFFIGNKEEKGQIGWCEYFASLGYVAVSVDYRLGFQVSREDLTAAEDRAFEDAAAALQYLLERDDLRIDPDRIFVAGTSAGAMLALRLAFRPEGPRIRAVANCWGGLHDLGIMEQARTAILSFQSTSDPVMPYHSGYPFQKNGFKLPTQWISDVIFGTAAVHARAVELGLRAQHYAYPEPQHRLHLDSNGQLTPRYYEIRDKMAAFFGEYAQGLAKSECPPVVKLRGPFVLR